MTISSRFIGAYHSIKKILKPPFCVARRDSFSRHLVYLKGDGPLVCVYLLLLKKTGKLANKTNQASHVIRAVGMSKNLLGGVSNAEKKQFREWFLMYTWVRANMDRNRNFCFTEKSVKELSRNLLIPFHDNAE